MAEKGLGDLMCSSTDLEHYLCEFFLSGRREITILLSGKTGAGKSHLTNALIGEELAEEGEELDPQTDNVSCRTGGKRFSPVSGRLWVVDARVVVMLVGNHVIN